MTYQWKNRGFTLIELLVVITVIAILAGITVPVVRKAIDKGKEAAARAGVANIENAWKMYFQEYGKWPIRNDLIVGQQPGELGTSLPKARGPEFAMKVEEAMVALLTGDPDDYRQYEKEKDNPKGVQFIPINQESLVKEDSGDRYGTYVDPWGNPYLFLLDVDFDNRIKHPQWHRESDEPPIARSVIAWSTGAVVGDYNSRDARRDDVVSW